MLNVFKAKIPFDVGETMRGECMITAAEPQRQAETSPVKRVTGEDFLTSLCLSPVHRTVRLARAQRRAQLNTIVLTQQRRDPVDEHSHLARQVPVLRVHDI